MYCLNMVHLPLPMGSVGRQTLQGRPPLPFSKFISHCQQVYNVLQQQCPGKLRMKMLQSFVIHIHKKLTLKLSSPTYKALPTMSQHHLS